MQTETQLQMPTQVQVPVQVSQPKSLLSCMKCRQRKVKCSRVQPCTNCQNSNAECIFPVQRHLPTKTRKARSQKIELIQRLSQFESFLEKYESSGRELVQRSDPQQEDSTSQPANSFSSTAPGPGPAKVEPSLNIEERPSDLGNGSMHRYISSDFWSSLSDQIIGMKQLLSDQGDSDDEPQIQETPEQDSPNSNYVFSGLIDPLPLSHPSLAQITFLCNHYIANVHPVIPIMHGPSLESSIQTAFENRENIPSGLEAILFAVCLSAVASMAESECLIGLGIPKDVALRDYRRNAERALVKGNLVNKPELATLQALTIYLFTIRANGDSYSSWTLTGLAIRIAYGLNLHCDEPSAQRSPFDVELRRRLWWELCVLDIRASEDRGSLPVIYGGSYNTKKPANINDEDFKPQSQVITSRDGWTDMSFGLILYELTSVIRQINYAVSSSILIQDLGLRQKYKLINDVEKLVREKYLSQCDSGIPFQWFASQCINMWFSRIRLMVYYPLQPVSRGLLAPEVDSKDVLQISTSVVESSYLIETNPDVGRWSWCTRSWSSWYALTIMLSELCILPRGPLADRAWTIANVVFEPWSNLVADNKRGMLWRPIKKLHKKAMEARSNGLGVNNSSREPISPLTMNYVGYSPITTSMLLDYNFATIEGPVVFEEAPQMCQVTESERGSSTPQNESTNMPVLIDYNQFLLEGNNRGQWADFQGNNWS